MRFYERRLPHFDVVGQPLFVTFRLRDSLPPNRIFPPSSMTTGKAFVEMDRILDHATSGSRHLANPEIAGIVLNVLHESEQKFERYGLHSYVIMPNHVHLLVTPLVPSSVWLRFVKGVTAREANRVLGQTGSFWQSESYDHLVRSGDEFGRIQRYIENNPVKAGLVKTAEEYEWSSAKACWKQAAG